MKIIQGRHPLWVTLYQYHPLKTTVLNDEVKLKTKALRHFKVAAVKTLMKTFRVV